MGPLKLNERIMLLRKEKGITQEELAQALGVTNQAVSKWESAQCCPDIQLLPNIATFFDVSIDWLMGYRDTEISDNLPLLLRAAIDNARAGDDAKLALKLVYMIHAILLSKKMQSDGNPGWDSDDAIEHAGKAEWGLSCISEPDITMRMRYGSVFFSDNRMMRLKNEKISILCNLMRNLSTAVSMKALVAVFTLTIHDESKYVSVGEIAKYSGLSEGAVAEQLENNLAEYLSIERRAQSRYYRIAGMYMHVIPLLAMICTP